MELSNDSPFFTTSDLLKTINNVIKDTGPNSNNDGNTATQSGSEGFELQRRMPDGSTRRADEGDIALADFQSKMKQTADKIANFSPDEKLKWANEQRQLGNKLYSKKKYSEAMDVYLTCLVAINASNDTEKTEQSRTRKDNTNNNDNEDDWTEKTDREIKFPVLLNLSACTLKLGMYRKTCSFCDMALELNKIGTDNPKVYFRRGKSYMLMGMHEKAKFDFHKCLDLLHQVNEKRVSEFDSEKNDISNSNESVVRGENKNEIEAVHKELLHLEKLKDAAEKNRLRHEKAMKIMLGGQANTTISTSKSQQSSNENDDEKSSLEIGMNRAKNDQNSSPVTPLYNNSDPTTAKKREFSTLRARRKKCRKDTVMSSKLGEGNGEEVVASGRNSQSYFTWYIQKVEFGLRKILFWLGDEEAMTRSFEECDEKKR